MAESVATMATLDVRSGAFVAVNTLIYAALSLAQTHSPATRLVTSGRSCGRKHRLDQVRCTQGCMTRCVQLQNAQGDLMRVRPR